MTPKSAAALRALEQRMSAAIAGNRIGNRADVNHQTVELWIDELAAVLTQEGAEKDRLHVVSALTQFSKRLRYGFQDYWADQLDTLLHSLFTQSAPAEPRATEDL